jgi:hypothetical protein
MSKVMPARKYSGNDPVRACRATPRLRCHRHRKDRDDRCHCPRKIDGRWLEPGECPARAWLQAVPR